MVIKWTMIGVLFWPSVLCAHEINQAPACRYLPSSEVETWLQSKKRLVFFASWCGSCAAHLQQAQSEPETGLILLFDEAPRGEQVLRKFGLANSCMISSDLAQRFKVEALPKTVLVPVTEN